MPKPHYSLPMIVIAVAANAVAQVGWVQHQPTTRPLARTHHSMTYDIARGVTVLFGGSGAQSFNDTWEWSGVDWTQRSTSNSPSARFGHIVAFDMGRARVVLFGGSNAPSGGGEMNDTWEFDGNNWTNVPTANPPSPRQLTHMVYDTARGRMLLFGGVSGLNVFTLTTLFNDTWQWDGATWMQRSPATSPTPRYGHAMVYDFARAEIVLVGGRNGPGSVLGDTWTWNGSSWSQVSVCCAPSTSHFGLAFDVTQGIVVRFGGSSGPETWLSDRIAWHHDSSAPSPTGSVACSLAHDLARGRSVLFGGLDPATIMILDETWEYAPGPVAGWTTYGNGCQGTLGIPVLRPYTASLPIIGGTFWLDLFGVASNVAAISFGFSSMLWNGNTLPFDLGAIGMTGCTLHASPDVVLFAPVFAGRATRGWVLPNNTSLIGIRFYNQGFVLDPGINPTGATVSNAGAGIIGPF
jgi:hypothetical protein